MIKQVVFYGLEEQNVSYTSTELNSLKSLKIKPVTSIKTKVVLRVINTKYPEVFKDKKVRMQLEPSSTHIEIN